MRRVLCCLGIHEPGEWEPHEFLGHCQIRRCVYCGSDDT